MTVIHERCKSCDSPASWPHSSALPRSRILQRHWSRTRCVLHTGHPPTRGGYLQKYKGVSSSTHHGCELICQTLHWPSPQWRLIQITACDINIHLYKWHIVRIYTKIEELHKDKDIHRRCTWNKMRFQLEYVRTKTTIETEGSKLIWEKRMRSFREMFLFINRLWLASIQAIPQPCAPCGPE